MDARGRGVRITERSVTHARPAAPARRCLGPSPPGAPSKLCFGGVAIQTQHIIPCPILSPFFWRQGGNTPAQPPCPVQALLRRGSDSNSAHHPVPHPRRGEGGKPQRPTIPGAPSKLCLGGVKLRIWSWATLNWFCIRARLVGVPIERFLLDEVTSAVPKAGYKEKGFSPGQSFFNPPGGRSIHSLCCRFDLARAAVRTFAPRQPAAGEPVRPAWAWKHPCAQAPEWHAESCPPCAA
jgi:hypothetical protein